METEKVDRTKNPYLYIFLRSDMKSMSPGRAAAQASHATSVFHHWMSENVESFMQFKSENAEVRYDDSRMVDLIDNWLTATPQGFGTTIVKGALPADMELLHGLAEVENIYADYVVDPDYVIKDGEEFFTSEVVTGLVLFGRELLEDSSQLNLLIQTAPLF